MKKRRLDKCTDSVFKQPNIGENMMWRSLSHATVDKAIVNFVIKDCEPFAAVEREGFQDLMKTLLPPGLTVMWRQTGTTRVQKEFEDMKQRLKTILKDVKECSINSDGWSKDSKGFMGDTVSYLDENLNRKVYALACKWLKGKHDYLAIAKSMEEVLSEFGILNKTQMPTTDGAKKF